MAKKQYRFNATIAVPDPAKSTEEVRSPEGHILIAKTTGIRYVPPGTSVELEEAEAQSIAATFGFFEEAAAPVGGPQVNTLRKPQL